MIYLELFLEFFKIGLFSIGGGAATIPFLEELSIKTGWFTSIDLANIIAISESTPGAIGVNMSTYAGYITAGIPGAIIASIGLIAPCIIVILIICQFLKRFNENKYVKYTFYGLKAASVALISVACFSIFKISMLDIDLFEQTKKFIDLFDFKAILLFLALFVLILRYKIHPIYYIFLAALIGIIFQFSI
ncbi:MAG: chromate transporter [Anaeroplasmataceae bacterium]